jgi:ubiquinone/menaquinone biosynthesis C-methylase UbiE
MWTAHSDDRHGHHGHEEEATMSEPMARVPEPELMDEAEQARAYSEADFEAPHEAFVDAFAARHPGGPGALTLDLGCGPADITTRFARRYAQTTVRGVDGAEAMLALGRVRLSNAGLDDRVSLHLGYVPGADVPDAPFDTVISNSLLHHLKSAEALWEEIKRLAKPGAQVFVMDLMRPTTEDKARWMVDEYAAGEPEVLRHDFFHSLKAAYTTEEVKAQLQVAGLGHLAVKATSDRHFIVTGHR